MRACLEELELSGHGGFLCFREKRCDCCRSMGLKLATAWNAWSRIAGESIPVMTTDAGEFSPKCKASIGVTVLLCRM